MPATLVDCVLALGRDDDGAWDRLVAVAGGALARTCARIAGPDLGQDALQECLLRVRRLARGFRAPAAGGDAAAMAWLQCVAATTACQVLRGRRRARLRDRVPPPAAVDDDAHAAVERSERHALLRRELARLPAAHREAVALHHLAGEPIAVVAQAQGIGEEAAKKRVQRGVATLRERLARSGLCLAPSALLLGLADAADAAPALDAGRAAADAASLPLAATTSGIAIMATAACVPAIALALSLWYGADAADAPLAAGDQPPPGVAKADAPVVKAPVEKWRLAMEERLDQQVTFDFEDTAFDDVINFFRQVTGLNIIVAPEVYAAGGGGTVTLRAKDMKFRDALKWVLELTSMHMAIQDQAIFISSHPIAEPAPGAAPAPVAGPAPGSSPAIVSEPAPIEPWRAAIEKALEPEVTLDFKDNDFVEVVNFMQRVSGVNMVIDPAVIASAPPPITLRVDGMKMKNVLGFIMRLANLRYVLRDEAVFITTVPPIN